ncbi:MAG: outer membrane beta-barrel protein [Ginsengibacter sp.]
MKPKRTMRDINDDMDDLFRRAAENYPLNTNSSDWTKVQNAMQSSENVAAQDVKSKKKYRRFLWLLLLLPFAFVIDKYAFQNHDNGNSITQHQPTSSEQKIASPKKIDSENFNREKKTEPTSLNRENLSPPAKIIQNKNSDGTLNSVSEGKNVQNKYPLKRNVTAGKDVVTEQPDKERNKDFTVAENTNKNLIAINKDFEAKENTDINKTNIKERSADIKEESTDSTDKDEIKTVENKPAPSDGTIKNNEVVKADKKIALKKSRSHSFYIGIVAGPDFSTVKLDKIIRTGFTLGVITGYKFNKRLSVETGLLLDKKYYYSEGKYFNIKNVYIIPYHAKLDNVDGYCNMIELPLNLKYNFKSNKKVNWFALAGISSYFMSKENYDYRYSIYGQQKEGNLSVKDASQIWASVMNLGLGYSHYIGKTGTLRVEPYFKIPFKGIGVGSLPITSSGIYFGFTKNLF